MGEPRRPLRVRARSAKVGLVLGLFVVAYVVSRLFDLLSGPVGSIVQTLVFTAGIIVLTRLFRGPDEGDAPRPTWRMTGDPGWSYGLGTLWLIGAFVGIVQLVVGPLIGSDLTSARDMGLTVTGYTVNLAVQTLTQILLMVLFVRSGRRLRAGERGRGEVS